MTPLELDSRKPSNVFSLLTVGTSSTVTVPVQKRRYYDSFTEESEGHLLESIKCAANAEYSIDLQKGFIWFTHKHIDLPINKINPKGVKFHISLSHEKAQYELGVLIVLDELKKFRHPHFKIVQPSFLSKSIYEEAGREVTIYAYMEPNKQTSLNI